jgi:MSHA biogenesis protein MshK
MKVILSCSLCLVLSAAVVAASDPTKPDMAMAVAVSATDATTVVADQGARFKLGLIKNVQGQHMALINGQSVKQGDEIEGYTVMSINRQQVVLQQANERLTLNLFKAMKTQ